MNKKYKALILDVDGTLMPNNQFASPSKKVINAIKKANKYVHVGIATARPGSELEKIFANVPLSGPSIINGGAQIIDLPSKKILLEQALSKEDVIAVCNIAKEFRYKEIIVNDNEENIFFSQDYIPDKPFQVFIPDISSTSDLFLKQISHLPNIVSHQVVSWKKIGTDIVINHSKATKQYGIFKVAKILGIKTHEIIGVGDGYNDFPLLMACGLKIAMGNAVDEIKAIADYIAPSVEKDGMVDVIEKFIL